MMHDLRLNFFQLRHREQLVPTVSGLPWLKLRQESRDLIKNKGK